MSSDPPAPPHNPLLHTAKEYLTHWFVAGVIVTLTGFTPDHWVANVFHTVNLDSLRGVFSEYQFLAVYTGVTFLIVDMVVRNRRRQFEPAAGAPALADASGFVAASADAPVLQVIEGKPSIAVLPFVNMSEDKSQEFFADGMTEDIITGLSFDSRLFVIARNSTAAYKGQTPDIRAVGKELGVRYVLEGSIRPHNDMLRITVQLIDTASGAHVWADRIDRPVAEIFAVMDEVVDGLVTTLCSNLGVAEGKRAARARPEDLQAWALCVQAETIYFLRQSAGSATAAESLLRRATEIEPGYALGWAHLGLMAVVRNIWGLGGDVAENADEAVALATRAMRLAPDDPQVLTYSGYAYSFAGRSAQALDCLEHSLDINPNNGLTRLYYGSALRNAGRPEAGLKQLDMFLRLSPKDPNAGFAYWHQAYCHLLLSDFQQAEQSARKAVKLLPGSGMMYMPLAFALAAQGHREEAQQQVRKAREVAPTLTRQGIEDNFRMSQTPEQAQSAIRALRHVWPD